MARLWKRLALVTLFLSLLGAAAVGVLPFWLDPNTFKDEISRMVERATGHSLSIGEPLRLSLFPWTGIELRGLTLNNPPGFPDPPLAHIQRAELRAGLWPLLQRRLVVEQVRAEGLRLTVQQDAQSRGNWESGAGSRGDTQRSGGPSSASGGVVKALAGLISGRVELTDAEVVWLDPQQERYFRLRGLKVTSGILGPDQPVDVRLDCEIDAPGVGLRGPLTLITTLHPSTSSQPMRLEPLSLRAELVGPIPAQGPLRIEANAGMELDLVEHTLSADPIHIRSGSLSLSGSAQGRLLGSSDPVFNGSLVLTELNPRVWLQAQGWRTPETANPHLLQGLAARSDWLFSGGRLLLQGLRVRLDGSQLQGEAWITPMESPAYHFQMAIDDLDLDGYRPVAPPSGGVTPHSTSVKPSLGGVPPWWVLGLARNLDLEGQLTLGALRLSSLRWDQVALRIRSYEGQVVIENRVGGVYQGQLEGRLVLNSRSQPPSLTLEQQGEGIQVGALLTDLMGAPLLTGQGQLSLHLATEGNSEEGALRNLRGEVDVRLVEGAVSGLDLLQRLRAAKARLLGEPRAEGAEPLRTPFSELALQGQIRQGVLHDDLRATSPHLRVTGKGTLDLTTQTLDYQLRPLILNTAEGADGQGNDLLGVPIPLTVTGPWREPQWRIDMRALAGEMGKPGIQERIDKKLEERGGIRGLGRSLRELLGR